MEVFQNIRKQGIRFFSMNELYGKRKILTPDYLQKVRFNFYKLSLPESLVFAEVKQTLSDPFNLYSPFKFLIFKPGAPGFL